MGSPAALSVELVSCAHQHVERGARDVRRQGCSERVAARPAVELLLDAAEPATVRARIVHTTPHTPTMQVPSSQHRIGLPAMLSQNPARLGVLGALSVLTPLLT